MRFLGCAALSVIVMGSTALVSSAATWDAADDLRANETSALELTNPNGTVPVWSYGHRTPAVSSSLTLFSNADGEHSNEVLSNGNTNLQGWRTPAASLGIPFVFVDVSDPNGPIGLHPQSTSSVRAHDVVRFTVPFDAEYTINASWTDADPNASGNGGEAFFVINGVAQSEFDGANPASGVFAEGGTASLSAVLNLQSGDVIDFVAGANGSNFTDSISFNATLTAVPEPTTLGLLASLAALTTLRRKR